jgi:hypothetical protein
MTTPVLCQCVKRHSPLPRAYQVHHVLPKGWGGRDVAANRITICGTCHDNIHHALDAAVRIAYAPGGNGTLTPAQIDTLVRLYTAFTRVLIRRAITEAGATVPHVYTLTNPGGHDA